MNELALARGLGRISLAMGGTVLAPARAARLFGLGDHPSLMRAIGLRDLAIGLGLLALADPALVFLGPDTGHLAWAGADVLAFCRTYAPRIKTLH